MTLSLTIIDLVVEKHLFLKVKGFICSTLSSVISLLLSIYNNQPFISFTSCQNAPFISWKSNPPRWMGQSCHENCKHGGGNVWKRINGPFLWKLREKWHLKWKNCVELKKQQKTKEFYGVKKIFILWMANKIWWIGKLEHKWATFCRDRD